MNETSENTAQNQLRLAQQALAKGDLDGAESAVNEVLKAYPDDPNASYTQAIVHRMRKNPSAAIATLDKLISTHPDFARAYQEKGINQLMLSNPKEAGIVLEEAVALDPSLIESWKLLVPLYKKWGSPREDEARQQVKLLVDLPKELVTVISYLSANRLVDAERLCRYFLRENKTHIEGMRLLAEIATRNNVLDDAEFLLETVTELAPNHIDARVQFTQVLHKRQRFHKAFDHAKKLLRDFPESKERIQRAYASACFGAGHNDEAIGHYLEMIEREPSDHFLRVGLGNIYSAVGQNDEAVLSFKKAAQLKPNYGDAYWSLANTKSYKFDDKQLSEMLVAEEGHTDDPIDKIQLAFAIGKAYEDRKDFERSFFYYERGNSLKAETTHYDPEQLQRRIDSQIEICSTNFFEDKEGLGNNATDPIFVLGLPRAGSTLLEQILASHSLVDGTMELHNIIDLAKRLRGRDRTTEGVPRYPKVLEELEDSYFKKFGTQFIEDTRIYRGDAPFFIDKMPNNFFHIGLIKLVLPNAKIIDARRHPMACCFSGYKQLFGEGQEFSYGLESMGNYYRQYVKLMDHWDQVLPGFVLRVQYEEVVENLESEVNRILNFCGLPFEDACLNFHQTKRSVRTPSAEQVRQPIYKSGLEQWTNYKEYLQPLIDSLGTEVMERYPISSG
tara:strand:- start:1060 stop:3075 length:2016 start_codon:yes stop_codon:yes gene_type:complete